jgi:hypothetical protein
MEADCLGVESSPQALVPRERRKEYFEVFPIESVLRIDIYVVFRVLKEVLWCMLKWRTIKCNPINVSKLFLNINTTCKIWGSHGGDYDDYHLLGDDAVWLL